MSHEPNTSHHAEMQAWADKARELERENAKLREVLEALYDAGRWMLPVEQVPLERQIALWEAAKIALGR